MKELFYMEGPKFMAILILFLIITTAWFIYLNFNTPVVCRNYVN